MPAQTIIQFRRGSSGQWSSSINPLYQGELGLDTTINKIKIGDGTSLWSSLSWANITGADLVGSSGINISYNSASGTVNVSVTGLTSSYLSDFSSSVSGLLPVKSIVAGNNITVTPSGDNGFVISSPVNENTVKDIIGSTISGVSGIAFSYDSVGKTATISLSDPTIQSTDVTDFNSAVSGLLGVKSLIQSTGIGISNNGGIQTISVTGIPSSLITDFSSSVGSVVSTELVGGSGIELSYNSGSNSLVINTTGVSYAGHSHLWSNITDASSTVSLTELSYLSGVVPGTASAGKTLVLDIYKNLSTINNLSSSGTLSAAILNISGSGTIGDLVIGGNLIVNGSTTTINSTTITVDDKNLELGSVASPTDVTADGAGITVKGATDKTFNWVNSTSSWTSSEHLDLASGKVLKAAGTQILSSTNYTGKAATAGNADTVTTNANLTGPITSIGNATTITAGSISNSEVATAAAIAYSKLSLSNSIINSDISSSAAISVNKLASSGITFGSTIANLGNTISSFVGLTSISGTNSNNPTYLYNCVIDGGTP